MPKHISKTAAPSQRMLRVAKEVRHALSGVLARGDLRDPELADTRVTVTEVRDSPDLKHMTVFVSRLGQTADKALLDLLRGSGTPGRVDFVAERWSEPRGEDEGFVER